MDLGLEDHLVAATNRLAPRALRTTEMEDTGLDDERVTGGRWLSKANVDTHHDYLIPLRCERIHSPTHRLERRYPGVFEIREVSGVVDVVIGIKFPPPNMDGGVMHKSRLEVDYATWFFAAIVISRQSSAREDLLVTPFLAED